MRGMKARERRSERMNEMKRKVDVNEYTTLSTDDVRTDN
jgi:hypothetical protein